MINDREISGLDFSGKSIFKYGSIVAVLSAVSIAFTIIAFFIWPYKGNSSSVEDILTVLQTDRVGGLIAQGVSMLIIGSVTMLRFVARYIVLWRVNEPIALLALLHVKKKRVCQRTDVCAFPELGIRRDIKGDIL